MRARDELLAAIDREQALIGRLGREREEALARVRSLQAQLGTPGEDVDCSVSPAPPSTAGEKVALFRSLFRGRDDVFPKLWVNPRTDRKGYAPACWFLAADFDEASWADDVATFVETSGAVGLPSAVERSRSGNGAHVGSSSPRRCLLPRRDAWVAT